MSPRRPRGALLLAVALSATVAVPPALATTADADDPAEQLEQTRDELARAEADLAELLRRIDAVEAEVAAADAQLADLRGQLAAVEAELRQAQEVADDATAEVTEARGELSAAIDRQRAMEATWDRTRGALEARVAATWMHGSTDASDVLFGGLLQADDLHDIAVVRQASVRLLDHDRRLLEEAVAASIAATDARADASDVLFGGLLQADDLHDVAVVRQASVRLLDHDRRLLEEAVAASIAATDARADAEVLQQRVEQRAAAAYAARDVAEELVARQTRLVAAAARVREDREAALQSIEEDAAAKQALRDRLDAEIRELQLATLDQWLQQITDLPFDGPAPPWAAGLPGTGQRIAPAINAAAARGGVDGRLLAALVWTESSFNHAAVSPAGAIGLAQLMPGTAAGLGVDPYDPLDNLTGGARYLRTQLERFGSIDLALAAYNAGPQRVVDAGNQIPDIVETQLYVLRVLDRWESLG